MTNYPIGDFLIRVKNAAMAFRKDVSMPNNRFVTALAKVLKEEGYIEDYSEKDGLFIAKLSFRGKRPVVTNIKLVSKPGVRIYLGADELNRKKGPSIFLVSTPKGVMSSMRAIKERVGGEVLAEIW